MFLSGFIQKWLVYRHVCIVFLSNQPTAMTLINHCAMTRIDNQTKSLLLVDLTKMQNTRDDKPTICFLINQEKNMRLLLGLNKEFPKLFILLTMLTLNIIFSVTVQAQCIQVSLTMPQLLLVAMLARFVTFARYGNLFFIKTDLPLTTRITRECSNCSM